MPKLWSETVAGHRRTVQDAIIGAAWTLVSERGLLSVSMSQVAEAAGIGRATLYKYFPDVESILVAGHQRHVGEHLEQLSGIGRGIGRPGDRLAAVLEAYAFIAHHRRHGVGDEVAALLHRGEPVGRAEQQLVELFRDLLTDVRQAGDLREDVDVEELAIYCLHALGAAASLPSAAAVRRLVQVTLAALRSS